MSFFTSININILTFFYTFSLSPHPLQLLLQIIRKMQGNINAHATCDPQETPNNRDNICHTLSHNCIE